MPLHRNLLAECYLLRSPHQRHKLKAPLTPVTPESFAIWKKTRVDKKVAEAEAKEKAKAAARAAGKISGMSGKDLFDFSSDMLQDEDEVSGAAETSRLIVALT